MDLRVIDEGSLGTYRVIDESGNGYRFHFYPRGGSQNISRFKKAMGVEPSEFYGGYIAGYYGNIERTDRQHFAEFPQEYFEAICEYYYHKYNTKAILASISLARVEEYKKYGFKVLGDSTEGNSRLMVKELDYSKKVLSNSSVFSK